MIRIIKNNYCGLTIKKVEVKWFLSTDFQSGYVSVISKSCIVEQFSSTEEVRSNNWLYLDLLVVLLQEYKHHIRVCVCVVLWNFCQVSCRSFQQQQQSSQSECDRRVWAWPSVRGLMPKHTHRKHRLCHVFKPWTKKWDESRVVVTSSECKLQTETRMKWFPATWEAKQLERWQIPDQSAKSRTRVYWLELGTFLTPG